MLLMSAGPTCRSAYHLRRSGLPVVKSVFDWQVTPATAFAAYLDRDFRSTLDFLVQNVLIPLYPDAAVGKPFDLGHRIEQVNVRPAGVSILIGR